ncbi:DUF748 domain-containing protein [Cupriavidus taiwanensis]|uniref:DUF748 domain-containing protein n=1 Tax=Cupriavidus taiwanensis TaxID=164546 RepID=A0A7Z7JCY3_9BURK|nr:DUF748 domain-containing protein [Cupriavidus taiwanensis]SOZ08526.1 conserved hypothetical protein, DUF748 [Cupriavidus taiwanensis]SOZ10864.1 conserved hypothetical protein, DUF748 [Cupriavidus taiwanensis]SOZ42103.1 conserved hypothetical protein, DUF748 [Cupriavidus taiwanensis]SPC21225.1 conserved hypothetical protein, DUF748 [Cupriavidus taiwanensis]SPD55367.1 conserved protein of unknown function [Cupriavidus taiwanensis]
MAFKQSIQAAATVAATPRGRLAMRVAGGVAAALAVFGLAGYFGGPPLIKHLVEKQATEALGRKVTLGQAQVRPFELAATLTDLTIYERDGKTPALTLGEVQADTSLASVWHLAPVVDNLHVDRLAVHVVRGADGRMSFADVQEKFAALPPKPADAEPARFSVNNIAVTGSSVRYDDKLLDTTLRVDNLTLTLPFLSNLPHDVEIVTRPTLSAQVNGTPLALDGEVLPFADSRQTRLNINLDGLEVARMMAFAPTLRDAEVKSGKLDTRLTVAFRQQQDTQEMVVTGSAALRDAEVRTRAGQPLIRSGKLAVDIARLEPLAHRAQLRSVEIEGLAVEAARRADGSLNLATAFLPQAVSRSTDGVAPAPAPASAPSAASAVPAAPATAAKEVPWRYAVDRIVVRQARLGFEDALAPSGPGKLALGPLDAEVQGFAGTDGDKPVRVEATLTVADGQTLHHTGDLLLRDGSMAGTLETTGLRPQGFAAWWPRELRSQFGTTAVNAELHYRMAWGTPQFQFVLEKSRLELAPLYVATRDPVVMPAGAAPRASEANAQAAEQGPARRARDRNADRNADRDGAALPLLQAQKLVLDDIQFDLAKQTFATSQVTLAQPQIAATRDHRGELLEMARLWATESAQQARAAPRRAAPASANGANGANGAAAGGGWKASIGKVVVEGGSARLADYQPAQANRGRPVIHQFRNIGLTTGAVAWPLTPAAVPVRLHAESGRRGVIGIDGTVLPALPASRLQLDLRQVDVSPLQPYLADRFNAALRSGTLTVKGRLNVDAPAGKPLAAHFNGNVQAGNVRTVDRVSGDDFLRWRSLAVSGIDFAMDESKGPMRVGLGNIALSDFYARVILNANGRLNLQDVLAGGAEKGEAAPSTSLTQANPASAPASAVPVQAGDTRTAQVEQKPGGPKPQIRIGGVSVDKGNINFSDFFVKPNYTANLTGMKGSVSKVSSGDPTPADLVLDGRIDDDAPVNISGKLNPLGEQLFLDIAAKASGVELTRLTPYAAKYAGYPITKGKLTVDVAYKIENGKLDARNHLFLDQLTFGDRVDSPDATKLPVLLAVSLLKDRNGVIDVNLPVSGSLSDPEFSIGGVIVRVIVNLLTKAITSPFSLIASAFGSSGEELGYVEFAPGTATLTPAAKDKIAKLGQALNDRPSLRLEISGRIDPATDEAGARRAWLDARVAEQKRREQRNNAQAGGQAGDDEAVEQGADVKVSKAEYPKYLEQVYKRTSMKKPRNFVGFAKTLPPEEMEKLLMANATVTDADLKRLAEQRALVVKQALEREGKVPESRLFLTAPRLSAEGIKDKGTPNRVDFSIRG